MGLSGSCDAIRCPDVGRILRVPGRVDGIASWAVAWLAVFMAFLVRGGRQSVQVGLLRVPLYSCPVLAPECRAAPS